MRRSPVAYHKLIAFLPILKKLKKRLTAGGGGGYTMDQVQKLVLEKLNCYKYIEG